MSQPETLYCANHPEKETLLRCNRCEKPICNQCAVQTPTGYRCKECVRGQQKKFNTAKTTDLILAPLIAAGLSYIGSYMTSFVSFFTLLAAPFVGMLIERVLRLVIKNRRSNTLFLVAAIGAAVGSIPLLITNLLWIFRALPYGTFSLFSLLPLIWQVAYTILITSSVYYRLKGISIR